MSTRSFTFTSESVTEGHPDKLADQLSDAGLDAVLADDPDGRVACETLITTGLVVVAGEITTSTYVDIPRLVRERIKVHPGEVRVRRRDVRGDRRDRRAVAQHRPGRRHGIRGPAHPRRRRPARPGRRGRPGDDVRVRDRRDGGADAAADHGCAQDLPASL